MLDLYDIIGNIIEDAISTLKSFISRSIEFYDILTQLDFNEYTSVC